LIDNQSVKIFMDKTTCLKIFFPNGSFHTLRYTPSTSVSVGERFSIFLIKPNTILLL